MTGLMVSKKAWPVRADAIYPGGVVRGNDMLDLGLLQNWILGRGAQLIPWTASGFNLAVLTAATNILYYKARPTYQNVDRYWFVRASSSGSTGGSVVVAAPEDGTQKTFALSSWTAAGEVIPPTTQIVYVEPRASQARAEEELTLRIEPSVTGYLWDVACVEVPRAALVTGSGAPTVDDGGIDATLYFPGSPIVSASDGFYKQIGRNATFEIIGKRSGHYAWAVPTFKNGGVVSNAAHLKSTDAASTAKKQLTGLPVPLLHRALQLDNGTAAAATSATLAVRVRARMSGATDSGTVSFSTVSGNALTIDTVSGVTWKWYSGSVTVDTESHSDDLGLRASTWDDTTINAFSSGTTDRVLIGSICIFEDL